MNAQKLRTALNGSVMTSDTFSRRNFHTGFKTGNKWARLLRFNK
jgi:hypothetical protein